MKNLKNNKQLVALFTVLVVVLMVGGWLVFQNKDIQYLVGKEVTVTGTITKIEKDRELPDAPQVLTVELNNSKSIKTYSYCGYTPVEDQPGFVSGGLVVGDTVEIVGKATSETFIDVCNNNYSIREI